MRGRGWNSLALLDPDPLNIPLNIFFAFNDEADYFWNVCHQNLHIADNLSCSGRTLFSVFFIVFASPSSSCCCSVSDHTSTAIGTMFVHRLFIWYRYLFPLPNTDYLIICTFLYFLFWSKQTHLQFSTASVARFSLAISLHECRGIFVFWALFFLTEPYKFALYPTFSLLVMHLFQKHCVILQS